MLIEFLKTGRGIPFKQMFAMKEYPPDVMPLYAQGHSLAQWLIESRGKQAFLEFLADGMQRRELAAGRARSTTASTDLLTMQNCVERLGEARPAAADAGDVADRHSWSQRKLSAREATVAPGDRPHAESG